MGECEMINYKERLDVFTASLSQDEIGELSYIEETADRDRIPIIKIGARAVFRTVLAMKHPKKILEIGTAIGFSAILTAKELPEAKIVTIENYSPRYEEAIKNFHTYGYQDRITLLKGDAMELLSKMDDSYDFIFLDAAKGQYITMLPDIVRLLDKGAVLFTDNVLQDGTVMESRFAVERRDRTIHSRMREFLYEITHHDKLKSCLVPVDDGIAISVKL